MTLERGHAALALRLFIALPALVDEFLTPSQHEVHHARQLAGRVRVALGLSMRARRRR